MPVTTEVIVQESGKGRFTQNITIGEHSLIADEPKANGGNDTGPSPYDFILAGLGACTSMTLRMYAEFKKIPLKKITVTLTIEKIHGEDCVNCEDPHSKIDHITRMIQLDGELTDEQRTKLLDIANKCPVHRTLTSKVLVSTQLV